MANQDISVGYLISGEKGEQNLDYVNLKLRFYPRMELNMKGKPIKMQELIPRIRES
jgi:hypothetical protein